MKLIPIGHGQFATVSDKDFDKVSPYSWSRCGKKNRYIHAWINRKFLFLHRFILNARSSEFVDRNLRRCTPSQSIMNRRRGKLSGSKSRFKGVWFRPDLISKPWVAEIIAKGKRFRLGYFETQERAARAYNRAARKLHGRFACINRF